MKTFFALILLARLFCGCRNQTVSPQAATSSFSQVKPVGGGCDGCEAIYDMPKELNWIDTLPDWTIPGTRLEVSGIIYQQDGTTPATDVVLYVYHTDTSGHYTEKPGATGFWHRHGYIRGWMKTDAQGRYKFYTNEPVAYPDANIPAHIHPVIKEPDKNEYYIDEFIFDNDPLVTKEELSKLENRGGSGLLHPESNGNGLWICHRNIILGRNIPGYPR